MEKILRRKFIAISVGVAVAVVFGMAVVLNLQNYMRIDDKAEVIIEIIRQHGGVFPDKFMSMIANIELPREAQFTTRYFTLNIDDTGNVLSVDVRHINSVNLNQATEYAQYVVSLQKNEGYFENFKYKFEEMPFGTMIIFLDCEADMIAMRSFLIMSVQMVAITLSIFTLLMVFVSKFAVAPIVQSYKKQQRFITDVSHELKTPLAIIKTNTEVIEMVDKSEWTDSIHNQINRLSQLVNYLISLSKMEEQSELHLKSEFSLSDCVLEIIGTFSVVASGEKKEIICDINPEINLLGDEQSVRMLISILIDNSIKYSIENTKITITLAEKRSKKVFKITNYAENLNAENYNRLVERFYRLDDSRNSKTGGFGIGLATAKAIVKSHLGDIKAESLDGKQITFTVEL